MTDEEEAQTRKNREIIEALRAQFEPALEKLTPETESAVVYSLVKATKAAQPGTPGRE